jgi:hypothetical protein
VRSITAVQPIHVAGYIEELTRERSAPTAKQRLAAIRHLFDWLVVGQIIPVNPAGITAYLKNGGTLENAAAMAHHASTRTTQLYDRRSDKVSLDEVERISI